MQLRIRLYADLVQIISDDVRQRYTEPIRSGSSFEISVPDDFSVADLIGFLELPEDTVKVVFVNGRAREGDWSLKSGNELGIFPLVGGG